MKLPSLPEPAGERVRLQSQNFDFEAQELGSHPFTQSVKPPMGEPLGMKTPKGIKKELLVDKGRP